jgi:hypothetical protein
VTSLFLSPLVTSRYFPQQFNNSTVQQIYLTPKNLLTCILVSLNDIFILSVQSEGEFISAAALNYNASQ